MFYSSWGKFPRALSFLNFFFPLGVFFPLLADLYIISRVIKGHAISLWTGRPFKLEDELFCLQRTFALLEAQIESVKNSFRISSTLVFHELPQALFQLALLCIGKTSDTALVSLSVAISLCSLFLQLIQLAAVAKKESYPSIFSLVEALSRGDFISGVNKIRENTSSILNVTFGNIYF